jgi:predicted DNA binding CopG/RHH family protein
MKTEPHITHFIDEEEQQLVAAIEHDDYQVGESRLTPERRDMLQRAAKATINPERVRISLRVPATDLSLLKAQALKLGMPYQTLINAILHKSATEPTLAYVN